MKQVAITLLTLLLLLDHSTSGQYPDCGGSCQRNGFVQISQPPLSYTTMRSDEFSRVQPTNDGCTPVDGQETVNCGVNTTLMDCERGPPRSLDFSDLSNYFVWNRTSTSDRTVSTVVTFGQPVTVRRVSLWFWNAPTGGVVVPNLMLYSSNDNSTTPSNLITIDTSDSAALEENERYRLNVDITDEGLMIQSLRILMTISEGTHTFLSEVLFCVSSDPIVVPTMAAPESSMTNDLSPSTMAPSTLAAITTTTMVATMSSSTSTSMIATTTVVGAPLQTDPAAGTGSDGGSNTGVIIAPIVVILVLIIVIIALVVFFLWYRKRRSQKKFNVDGHNENYYDSVQESNIKLATVITNTSEGHFDGTLNGNNIQSNVPVYSAPKRKDSRKEASTLEKPQAVEKTQSIISNQSSAPVVPYRTSAYDETATNTVYDQIPATGSVAELDAFSMDNEVLDDSFDEEEDGSTPVRKNKKGLSPRRGKSKSPSKTPTRKPNQQSTSSSTPSNVLSPLKSTSSQTSSLQRSMQFNPLYAGTQSLELNIYDSIKSPKCSTSSDFDFAETIYSEVSDPDALITTEDTTIDLSKAPKDLYPYSSIYAEPLPLDKSEGPPIVTEDNIVEVKQLGTGQFGEVVLANTAGLSEYYLQLSPREDCTVSIQVAVKKLKLDSTKEMQKSFEKEIKFMSRLKDDNVIRLLGICTSGTPFIMMEYMENGDLNQYLQSFDILLDPNESPSPTQITPITLIYMACQIASGMKYLSSLKYVHRDLATRNVLVGKDYVVKIADFGMSQNLYSAYYFKVKGRAILPIRWMAYECFFGKFSVKTDVWAFGITLWEIFTLCKNQPYHEMGDQQVIDSALKGEKRLLMPKPDNCSDEIYEVMLSCWTHDPSKRANFSDLYNALKEITNRQ